MHMPFNEVLAIGGSDTYKYLEDFFSTEQLEEIESAFERSNMCNINDGILASNFVFNITEASERMRLIMENIIANKGTFKPSRLPSYKGINKWVTPGFTG